MAFYQLNVVGTSFFLNVDQDIKSKHFVLQNPVVAIFEDTQTRTRQNWRFAAVLYLSNI